MAQDASPVAQAGEPALDSRDDYSDDENVIVVLGARLIGQLDVPQPPILVLDAQDIAAYGAGSIAELLQALGPQVSSGRGRGGGGPVILVNGVRISSFRELRSYPPEAIEKTEVFSEEVAQQYGYSPNQRVVNFVLKSNFSSREIELEYGQPFRGGLSQQDAELTYLKIAGQSRLNFNLEWNNSSLLTESERGVDQAESSAPGDPDPALYRSLVSDSAGIEATANWSTKLDSAGNSLSVNGTFERSDSLSLQGLDTVRLTGPAGSALRTFNQNDPLSFERRTDSYAGGATLDLGLGDWQVTATADGTISDSRGVTQRRAFTQDLVDAAAAGTLAIDADLDGLTLDAGFDEALTRTYTFSGMTTARGNPVYLPAGEMSVTLDAGYKWNRIDSQDTRNPLNPTDLSRSRLEGGVNIGIPLTARDEFLGMLGDITLNLSGGVDELSDFGTLYDWSVGLTWGLTDKLTLSANHINRDEAPSLSQLGNPEVATENVPVFDLTNSETVLATVISGGNPNLPSQSQSDWSFGANWQLPFLDQANVTVEYIRNHSENVAGGLPTLTPAIEAAFPGRVTRDNNGRLLRIDQRPVSFAEQDVERLQFGINFSGQIAGPQAAEAEGGNGGRGGFGGVPAAGSQGGAPAGAGRFGQGGAGGAGGPPGGFNPERFQQMRAQFCEADQTQLLDLMNRAVAAAAAGEEAPTGPDGQALAIPPQMLERLAGPDGKIDPERFNAIRGGICNANAAPAGAQGGTAGGPPAGVFAGGPPPGGFGGGNGGPPRGAGGPGGGGGFRGFGGPGGGGGGGRWFFNLNYQLDLNNTVLIAPGVPVLDLLDGDALTGGGQARHGVNARMGVFYNGFGLLSFWTYNGKSRLDGSGLPGSTDLFFEDRLTVNLRSFADLGQREKLVEAVPFFKNARIGIGIDNLFDSYQRVTDGNGDVPLSYQRFLVDPQGRSFEIEFRKMF